MLKREAAPLRVQAVNVLRKKIVAGEYPPRARLTEKHLEEELGVSRTVVREALRQLESEQLIEIEPNVGPLVRELTYDDVVNLYQVRGTLESAAGRLAAQSARPEHIDGLRHIFEIISTRAATMPMAELIELKKEFYRALIEASGNPIIGEMLANVQARISQLRAVTLDSPGRAPHMIAELARVLDAIESGDPVRAAAECQAHVDVATQIALRHAAALQHQKEEL
ncbi:GntR family transcriptional regulator [Cryobacterium sp. N19]|uniref:GntR family transcriptional regulator n=1 Tax=Cryobacterium sp. N19 TaxID=2048288 RepID=UPI0013047D7F|nr:GntR family transcriptional regulator [Cryobacterium sp. N19]